MNTEDPIQGKYKVDRSRAQVVQGGYVVMTCSNNLEASECADKLNAAFKRGYHEGQRSGWVPVSALPEVGQTVLVRGIDPLDPDVLWYAVLTFRDFGWAISYSHDEWDGYPPTEWQPLPQPPNP